MYALTPRGSGGLQLGKELGKGGEGSVYAVTSHGLSELPSAEKLVAKIYHEPSAEERPKKLKAMIANAVEDPAVAWPLAVILDDQKRFLGYLMKRLESDSYREWLYLANAKDRRKVAPAFDVRYAYAAVRNLAAALLAVHHAGHRVGDINESNIFAGADATVLIVDTDSMQISARDGAIFPCAVGKPEFTAPELSRGSLRDHRRTVETDIFAFAVAAHQLLTGGATPHQGTFDPNSDDDPMPLVERIRQGVLPSLDPLKAETFGFSPRPGALLNALPATLKAHLKAFLSVDPQERNRLYSLETLVKHLDEYIPTLERCSVERLHWHPKGSACAWCADAIRSKQDPWASAPNAAPPPAQARLTPIDFQDSSQPSGGGRAAAAIAGQQAHAANQQAAGNPAPTTMSPANAPAQNASPQQQSSPAPQYPHKVKGKVVLEYADGSRRVRPPLGVLMRQSPKTAIWALQEETPNPLKFWWPVDRDLANPGGLVVGTVFGAVAAVAWYFLALFLITNMEFFSFAAAIAGYIAIAPAATTFLASVILMGSGLNDRRKARKKYGDLKRFKQEKLMRTSLRFLPLGFFYGIPIVIVLLFVLGYLLAIFAKAVAKS